MRFFVMFVTAVCVLFLIKLRWPKKKNFYDTIKSLLHFAILLRLYILAQFPSSFPFFLRSISVYAGFRRPSFKRSSTIVFLDLCL